MELSAEILSDITVYMKYARHLSEVKRRETWEEVVERNKEMHIKNYSSLKEEIDDVYRLVLEKKVLPSMRSMQFAGKPIEIANNRIFNCSYLPIDDWRAFPEVMFLLLGGSGVGYSVQYHHVDKLPEIKRPIKKTKKFLISDSIEGWADAVKILIKSYFFGLPEPKFDYSDIRPKGANLVTSGGKAPGPQPLKDCIHNLKKILDQKEVGDKLTTLECHDMICYIADAVLAGGIRRAALLSLFSLDDEGMLACKFGNWWEKNPQRARANNSATILRHRVRRKDFNELWKKIELSKSGEPGIFFTNDKEIGSNPCLEISLKNCQFCNLTTINVSDVETQEELNKRVKAASFLGTLQAGYTDFHYLREIWKKNTEKEALLGVSMTGIASGKVFELDLEQASEIVKKENIRVAKLIGIKKAARTTCIKPEGTSSLVLGTSSGNHAWHNDYYIRRIRVGKNEAIYRYLKRAIPKLVEDDFFKPNEQAIILVPIKAPEGSILRSESALELLKRVKKLNQKWITPGHIKGSNKHNVSTTVSIKEDEWQEVGEWMWNNREFYNGLSVLPYDNGTYVQAPFTDCTREEYEELLHHVKHISLLKVVENEDNTDHNQQVACGGGKCEII